MSVNRNDNVNFLNNFFDAMDELFTEDEKLTDEYLISIGKNPKKIESSGMKFIEELQGKARLKAAKQKRIMLEEFKNKFNVEKGKLTQEAKERLLNLLKGNEQLSFAFRKIETLSDEDILEMLSEQDLLNYLNRSSNNEH